MGVKSPRRVSAKVSRSAAPLSQPAVALPSPTVLSAVLSDLWRQHHAHDAATAGNRGVLRDYVAAATGRCLDQICAVEDLLTVSTPATAADAVAVLVVIRSKMDDLSSEVDGDLRSTMRHLLVAMMPAMAVLARSAGFDLATQVPNYISVDDAMCGRGEVAI